MVYHFIDASQRYIQELGFFNIQNLPIGCDPHGLSGSDNSHYLPGSNRLAWGEGGVDDAEDADVILHEYGHAIQHGTVPGWGGGQEGAMGEGFGDYWAGSYSQTISDFNSHWVFNWDGHNNWWPGRVLNSTKHYPEDIVGQVHSDGEIWSAGLWSARNDPYIGREVMDKLVLQGHFYLGTSASMVDGAIAILTADEELYNGAHLAPLIFWFDDRGFIDADDYPLARIEGTITDLDSGDPLAALVWLENENGEILAQVEADSFYFFNVNYGTFTVNDTIHGYFNFHSIEYVIDQIDTFTVDLVMTAIGVQPENLSAVSQQTGVIPLVWEAPAGDEPAYYRLYRGDQPGGPYQLHQAEVNGTSFDDYDVLAGHEYFYVVTAIYEDPGGESLYSNEALAMAGQTVTLPYESDFEQDQGGMYIRVIDEGSGEGFWQRGSPDPEHGPGQAASGQNLWATGLDQNYGNGVDIYLLTPLIDLTSIGSAWLTFNHWFEFEGTLERGDDGGNVAVSTDGGIEWIVVQPRDEYGDQGIPGLDQEPGFTGSSEDWVFSAFNLSDFGGSTISIRFRVGSDLGINRAGWFIDNVYMAEQLAIEDENDAQTGITTHQLAQNFPNPFNPFTTISFQIPADEKVSLKIYNTSGQLIKTLVDKNLAAGSHSFNWDGSNNNRLAVSSGIYFYRMATESYTTAKRMILLK